MKAVYLFNYAMCNIRKISGDARITSNVRTYVKIVEMFVLPIPRYLFVLSNYKLIRTKKI